MTKLPSLKNTWQSWSQLFGVHCSDNEEQWDNMIKRILVHIKPWTTELRQLLSATQNIVCIFQDFIEQ